ncbi:Utp13 domain-containing protein [Aphelenchoides besseyi]|nr:Utp13 domain-containing protein [Aphelenchoides besseyi]
MSEIVECSVCKWQIDRCSLFVTNFDIARFASVKLTSVHFSSVLAFCPALLAVFLSSFARTGNTYSFNALYVKSGVCEKTVECHEDKIWSIRSILPSESSLKEIKRRRRAIQERNKSEDNSQQFAMRPEEHVRYITAGSDGRIVLWEDVTEEYAAEQARIAAERMDQIQTLENFIRLEKFEDALALTSKLDHPHQCYKLLNVVVEKNETAFKTLLSKLSDDQLLKLMDFVSQ